MPLAYLLRVIDYLLNADMKTWEINFSLCSSRNCFWTKEDLCCSLFKRSHVETKGNRYKLCQKWFCLDVRKNFFYSEKDQSPEQLPQ